MRRAILVGLALVLALAGFYVIWPAWMARQIRYAIETNDPPALERYVDFPAVRARAKPLVAAEMQRSLERLKREAGPIGAAIAGQLKESLGARIADAAIDSVLTPANVVRMVRQGKDLRRVWKDVTGKVGARQRGGTTPDADPPAEPAPDQPQGRDARPRKLTLANIKGYRLTGPLSLAVGIARDPAQAGSDVVAELAFTGTGWHVVGIVPQL